MAIRDNVGRKTLGLALVCAIALLSACATGVSEDPADDTLSGGEIRQVIAGNTVVGSMADGTEYAEFYAANGKVHGADYTGDWAIDGDRMCFDYPAGETCYRVAVSGDTVSWIRNGEVEGSGTLHPGNPRDF